MRSPTHEDAILMVQLAQWGTTLGVESAISVLLDDAFLPDEADVADQPVQILLTFAESIATLVKHDLLSRVLITDWIWLDGLWDRVAPAVRRARVDFGEARLYENFEAMVAG